MLKGTCKELKIIKLFFKCTSLVLLPVKECSYFVKSLDSPHILDCICT